jgi:hypothetical protein
VTRGKRNKPYSNNETNYHIKWNGNTHTPGVRMSVIITLGEYNTIYTNKSSSKP